MTIDQARERSFAVALARAGACLSMAGFFLLGANSALQNAVAEGDTRTISFHHLHTGEDITITFKRDGRYDEAALKKLDWFMRDWRKEKSTHMDPHLFDLVWETYREVGATRPIDVVCGYRSPETNSMLRARSGGVAQFSQHINGQAMDFFIPGVALEKIREVGLRLQRGGVGFYPTSGSPFVHLDTGTIRHWPRMTHDQLVKVFPDGRTVHIPSDGHPLHGYALALADVEQRGARPSEMSLEAARESGISAEQSNVKPKRSLLARLFGKGKDDDEASEEPAPRSARAPVTVASVTPAKPKAVSVEHIVPLPTARPSAATIAMASVKPAKPGFVTASLGSGLFDNRGYWRGAVQPGPDMPKRVASAAQPFETTGLDTHETGSTALAYAPESDLPTGGRARPMGAKLPRLPREATVMPAHGSTTVVAKPAVTAALPGDARNSDSLWLRAAILAPSVSGYLTATRLGAADMRSLQELMHKPPMSVMMTFSGDPHLGMVTSHFSGPAVVFLATTTFTRQSTASLQ